MGISWPSHKAQPLGAKLPVKILISARNGFDIMSFSLLVLRGEYPLQGDNEIKHQVRRHVLVWLTASSWQHTSGIHCRVWCWVVQVCGNVGPQISSGSGKVSAG